MEFCSKKLIATFISAIVLSGCSQTLEWNNADIRAGKVYRNGDDKPFSGLATNIPADVLQDPLKPLSGAVNAASSILNGHTNIGSYMTVFSMFNDSKHCDVEIKKGYPAGQITCYYTKNGGKLFEAEFKDGILDGTIELHAENGNRYARYEIVDGRSDGTIEQWFTDKPDTKHLDVNFDPEWKTGEYKVFHGNGLIKKHVEIINGEKVKDIDYDTNGERYWTVDQARSRIRAMELSDVPALSEEDQILFEQAAARNMLEIPMSFSEKTRLNDICKQKIIDRLSRNEEIDMHNYHQGNYPEFDGCFGGKSYEFSNAVEDARIALREEGERFLESLN